MSEAAPDVSEADALLGEVAALDMALLRHVNAVALATTDPDTLNGLVRSQQRLARSVRTTLTTKAKLARERADAAAKAPPTRTPSLQPAERRLGYDPERALMEEVSAIIRLEYDPAEADAIEYELEALVDEVWEDDGYDRLLPAERVSRLMAHVRTSFGPSATRPAADPAADSVPAAAPPPGEPASPPASAEAPYTPPWERRPPHALDRGGGSGW